MSTPAGSCYGASLLIHGVHLGDHCLTVALGIAADGQETRARPEGRVDGNATVCQGALANLPSRGLRRGRRLLLTLDGSKALRVTCGDAARVQRCQAHKMRNILEYLSDRDCS